MSKYGQVLLGVLDSMYCILWSSFNFQSETHPKDRYSVQRQTLFCPWWHRLQTQVTKNDKGCLPTFTRHHGRSTNFQATNSWTRHLSTCTPSGSRSCVLLLLHKNFTVWINWKGNKKWTWLMKLESEILISNLHWAQTKISWLFILVWENHATLLRKFQGFVINTKFYENGVRQHRSTSSSEKSLTSQSVRSTNGIKKQLTTS